GRHLCCAHRTPFRDRDEVHELLALSIGPEAEHSGTWRNNQKALFSRDWRGFWAVGDVPQRSAMFLNAAAGQNRARLEIFRRPGAIPTTPDHAGRLRNSWCAARSAKT